MIDLKNIKNTYKTYVLIDGYLLINYKWVINEAYKLASENIQDKKTFDFLSLNESVNNICLQVGRIEDEDDKRMKFWSRINFLNKNIKFYFIEICKNILEFNPYEKIIPLIDKTPKKDDQEITLSMEAYGKIYEYFKSIIMTEIENPFNIYPLIKFYSKKDIVSKLDTFFSDQESKDKLKKTTLS